MKYRIITEQPRGWMESGVPRTHSRLHLTDIIEAIDEEFCISDYKQKRVKVKVKGQDGQQGINLSACADLGFSFEVMMEEAFKRRMIDFDDLSDVVRLPEVERSGIVCSPDGFKKSSNTLLEYKCRWKSSLNFDIENEWKMLTQIKSYLMALKDTHCNGELPLRALLFVLFIQGDYRGNFPILRCYELEFKGSELWDNWLYLTQYARENKMYSKFESRKG